MSANVCEQNIKFNLKFSVICLQMLMSSLIGHLILSGACVALVHGRTPTCWHTHSRKHVAEKFCAKLKTFGTGDIQIVCLMHNTARLLNMVMDGLRSEFLNTILHFS
jgi:hypothetical protein